MFTTCECEYVTHIFFYFILRFLFVWVSIIVSFLVFVFGCWYPVLEVALCGAILSLHFVQTPNSLHYTHVCIVGYTSVVCYTVRS